MNKNIFSALICAVLAFLTIICTAATAVNTRMPEGKRALNKIIKGCEKMSPSKITANYTDSILYTKPDFSRCAVMEDYLKACGICFSYMNDEKCTTDKIYIAGANENTSANDSITEFTSLLNGNSRDMISEFYIAADYVDGSGEKRSTAKCFFVMVDDKTGKVIGILS